MDFAPHYDHVLKFYWHNLMQCPWSVIAKRFYLVECRLLMGMADDGM